MPGSPLLSDSQVVMADLAFFGLFAQDRSWDAFGTGIQGTHQSSIGSRMPVLLVVPPVDSKLDSF